MKKLSLLAVICLLFLFLAAGCSKTVKNNPEDMLELIRAEFPFSIPETMEISIAGSIEQEDALLLCIITGNQLNGYNYFAVEFYKGWGDRYTLDRITKMYCKKPDIANYLWSDKYLLLMNREDLDSLYIRTSVNGETYDVKAVDIPTVPFLYPVTSPSIPAVNVGKNISFITKDGDVFYY